MEEAPDMISSRTLTRSTLGTIACVAAAFVFSGCANSGSMTPSSQGLSRAAKPASASGYTFYTVDYPYTSPNRVTGIADNQEIVGVYGDNSSSNAYHSYTSQYNASQPYTQFQKDDYPNAPSTYMASINAAPGSSGSVQAGYVITPGDLLGNWGVLNNNGLWTLIRRHRGEGKCHMMELFGINNNDWAVGFYWYDLTGTCSKHTQNVTEVRPGEAFHDFTVSGANPTATGLTKGGWLVGITDNSGSGPTQGWSKMVCKGCSKGTEVKYWNYNNNPSLNTQLLGVNNSNVAVGTYQDSSGNWHGLIATNLFSVSQSAGWQSIDEPNGNQTNTVISGIDSSGDICGWYTGYDGLTHGFVGIYQ